MRISIILLVIIFTNCSQKKKVVGSTENGGTYIGEKNEFGLNNTCYYYDSLGILCGRVEFKNGLRQGDFKHYYSDGKIKVDGVYSNGKLFYSKTYGKNGDLVRQVLPNGQFIDYYYYKDKKIFVKSYEHYGSGGDTVVDSVIYNTYTGSIKYKYILSEKKLSKSVNNSQYAKIKGIGETEEEFIKIILGKDTTKL